MKAAEKHDDNCLRRQVLIDSFHVVKTAVTLLHPIAPSSCEMVREYLNLDIKLWSWDYIFEPIYVFIEEESKHKLKYLAPRVDFFKKHERQFYK